MSMTDRSIVAGVFQNETNAKQAMADLQSANFTDDQIRYSIHRGGDGITDSLVAMGFSQDEADYYNSEFLKGRTVVTVKSNDRLQEAYDILMRNSAYDANNRQGQTSTDYVNTTGATNTYANTSQTAGTAYNAGSTVDSYTDANSSNYVNNAATTDANYATDANQKIRLREEQLLPSKERVQAGEVGIHKEVITEEKTLNVPVSREEVYIERTPVTGDVTAEDFTDATDEVIRVPVSEERVTVTKQPVVTEEINVGKRVVQENQQVTDTVRHEEARIDRTGNVNLHGADEVIDDSTTTGGNVIDRAKNAVKNTANRNTDNNY